MFKNKKIKSGKCHELSRKSILYFLMPNPPGVGTLLFFGWCNVGSWLAHGWLMVGTKLLKFVIMVGG